jgi:alpha-beta hydrolase superfamily lysophospholipase
MGQAFVKRPCEEGHFVCPDGVKLFYRFWAAEKGSPLFLITHGFGEHSARYVSFVSELSDFPVSFAALDLRGHGRSEGERVWVGRFEEYVADTGFFLDFLAQQYGVRLDRVLLFGHSMGGAVACWYALEKPEGLQALILSSPCFALELWVPFAEKLIGFGSRLFPRAVINNPVPPVLLTHDPEEARAYTTDPLIQRRITWKLTAEMLRAGEIVRSRARSIHIPLYMIVAGKDRIVKTKAARHFFNQAGSSEKRWVELSGFYHEIFKEQDRRKAFDVLRAILAKRTE